MRHEVYKFLLFQSFLAFCIFFWVFGSLHTSLRCIMEKLAGGGWVAAAVSIIYRWQEKYVMWYVTHDTWRMTHDIWHMIFNIWYVICDVFFVVLSVSLRFGIGATFWTCPEIQGLPNAGFLFCLWLVVNYETFK